MSVKFFDWLAELRRRKVFRVGVVYAVVALGIIEATDLVLGTLGVPDWVTVAVVVVALAGFPIALVLAWALEVTPDGVRRTEPTALEGAEVPRRMRRALLEAGLLVAILIAGTWVITATRGGVRGGDAGLGADRASVAVLPFTNLSGDPEHQYFADGLAEELLNELARLEALRVAARTSSFAFRDSAVDVPRITQALGVATVLEGSFRSGGDRILVNVQLVNADGFQLWSEEYERPLADVFDIQDDIAREIARELGGRLLVGEAARLDVGGTTSVQAHESYLRGLYAMGQRTGASLREAVRHFQRAVDQDSDYAAAHAGLAQAYYLLPLFAEDVAPEPMAFAAKEAANEAIRLDPGSAEAYAALGGVAYQFDWDLERAEAVLRRAIDLAPSNAAAHQWLGETLAVQGRFDDAFPFIDRAIELDPVAPIPRLIKAFVLWYSGRADKADAVFREVLRMDPSFGFALFYYPDLLIQLGEYERAREVSERAAPLYLADDPAAAEKWRQGVDLLIAALQDPGRREEAIAHWSGEGRPADLYWAATSLARLGDLESSMAALRDMRNRRDLSFVWLPARVRWLPELRTDPGYQALIREAGLSPMGRPLGAGM